MELKSSVWSLTMNENDVGDRDGISDGNMDGMLVGILDGLVVTCSIGLSVGEVVISGGIVVVVDDDEFDNDNLLFCDNIVSTIAAMNNKVANGTATCTLLSLYQA